MSLDYLRSPEHILTKHTGASFKGHLGADDLVSWNDALEAVREAAGEETHKRDIGFVEGVGIVLVIILMSPITFIHTGILAVIFQTKHVLDRVKD